MKDDNIKISKCDDIIIPANKKVKIIEAGNHLRATYSDRCSYVAPTHRISRDYCVDRYGELIEYKHYRNKSHNPYSVNRTLDKCIDLIDTNFLDISKVLFCTLTYRGTHDFTGNYIPMIDYYCASKDAQLFMRRLRRHHTSIIKYIYTIAPQFSGSWHIHMLLHFTERHPRIDNKELESLWGKGHTEIQSVYSDIHNIAVYITKCQKDLDITDVNPDFDTSSYEIIQAELYTPSGNLCKKMYLRNAALQFYPSGCRMYKHNKGLTKPLENIMYYSDAKNYLHQYTMTNCDNYEITDEFTGFCGHVRHEYYVK